MTDSVEFIVRIDALDPRGQGRATLPDGRPLRVRGVDEGERARVAVPREPPPGRAINATLLELIEPSAARVDPRCAQVERCPGCTVRHLSPARQQTWQLEVHQARLATALATAGSIPWNRLPGAPTDGARSRAVARALVGPDGQLVLGLGRRSDPPVSLGRCPVQTPRVQAIIDSLERDLRALDIRPYDPMTRSPGLRHAVVHALGDAARVILACTGSMDTAGWASVIEDHPAVSVLFDELPFRGAGIMSRPRALRGPAALDFELDGDHFSASPRSWIPQAPSTVPTLRRVVVELLAPRESDAVLEIGCGIGISSLPVARRSLSLLGIDIERSATLDATRNAARNGVGNARFEPGDAPRAARRLLKRGRRFDLALVHAMRPPFGAATMAALACLGPRRIVYLAPDVRSLADDLAALPGYDPVWVGSIDQTPGTLGLLTICALDAQS